MVKKLAKDYDGPELPIVSNADAALSAFKETYSKINTELLSSLEKLDLPKSNKMTTSTEILLFLDGMDDPEEVLTPLKNVLSEKGAVELRQEGEWFLHDMIPAIIDCLEQIVSRKANLFDWPKDYSALIFSVLEQFRELTMALLSAYRYEATLISFVTLRDTFESFQSLPGIKDSPLAKDFITRLNNDLGKSRDPRELLASFGISSTAQLAADARHGPAREVKRRILEEYERRKVADPKLSKNKAAKQMAPLAVEWSSMLGASLLTMRDTTSAERQIRRWLSPSANGGDAMQ